MVTYIIAIVLREQSNPYSSFTEYYINLLPVSVKDVLGDVIKSDSYQHVMRLIDKVIQEKPSLYELEDLEGYLAGFLFEQFSYQFLNRQLIGPYMRLLSPEQTIEMYKKIYSDKKVVENNLGLKGIEGVSVPDGVILKKVPDKTLVISAIVEYTTRSSPSSIDSKMKKIKLMSTIEWSNLVFTKSIEYRNAQSYLRQIYGQSDLRLKPVEKSFPLLLVRPFNGGINDLPSGVEQILAPIHTLEITNFSRYLMQDLQNGFLEGTGE